jgi:MraZ protein
MEVSRSSSRGVTFLGSYLHQLDGKGRVSLPAPFRREASDQAFVLVQAYDSSLALFPQDSWSEVEERLRDLVRHQPEARMYVLSVMSSAVQVVPDGHGRMLIPARLQEAAQLSGEVLLVGAIDKIELWNPQLFERAVAGESSQFSRFAPQIFR